MQRRPYLMTLLLAISFIKQCKSCVSFRQDIARSMLKNNAARPKAYRIASPRHKSSLIGLHYLPNVSHQIPAFRCHQYFSTITAIMTSPRTPTKLHSLSLPPYTKSNLVTKPNPKQIYPEEEYILGFEVTHPDSTGLVGSGMVLFDSDETEIWWAHQCLGKVTANEAGYISLITGLQSVRSLGVQHITAVGCNQLISRQIEGTYKVKKPSLKEYYHTAVSLSGEFASFQVRYVNKSLNGKAVQLAKKAVDFHRKSGEKLVPASNTITLGEKDKSGQKNDTPLGLPNRDDAEQFKQGSISPEDATSPQPLSTDNSEQPKQESTISPEKTYVLRFDGGSRGNPGTAGSGMVLYDSEDGSELWSGCQYLGETSTNNEAEYMGLITGLQCARSLGVNNIVVQGDSKLILRQVEGAWQVKSPNLKDYHKRAVSLSKEFESFQTSHILRDRNARADELANEAMDTRSSRGFDVS